MRKTAILMIACLLAVGCASTPRAGNAQGGGAPTQYHLWAGGDSLSLSASWPSESIRPVYSLAMYGTGFASTYNPPSTITSNVMETITTYGVPQTLVLMGGVNDVSAGIDSSVITGAMQGLDDFLTSFGVHVVWVTEPAWSYRAGMDSINDWVRTRPNVADCAGSIQDSPAFTVDGTHPTQAGYHQLAGCILQSPALN